MFSVFVEPVKMRLSLCGPLLMLLCLVAVSASNFCLRCAAAAEVQSETKNAKTYKIIFQGNAAMSEAALRRDAAAELEAFEKEGHQPADIDDAAFQMQLAYRKAGYAFATVDYQIETKEAATTVTFIISEGPRVIIRDIIFVGNKAFDDDVLKAYFEKDRIGFLHQGKLLFVRSDVAAAVDEIRAALYHPRLSGRRGRRTGSAIQCRPQPGGYNDQNYRRDPLYGS